MQMIQKLRAENSRITRCAAGVGIALCLSTGMAAAATISEFQEVSGGAVLTGAGSATLSSTGIGFVGTASGAGPFSLVLSSDLASTPNQGNLLASFIPVGPSGPFGAAFQASLEDVGASSGIVTYLFGVNFDTTGDFGSHVLVTLSNSSFSATTLEDLALIIAPTTQTLSGTGIRVAEAAQVDVIPLPASVYLLGAALGGLGFAGRRQRRVRA